MDILFPDVIVSPAAPQALRHTLFFGLLPPFGVARQAYEMAEGLLKSGRAAGALRADRVLHVTLLLAAKAIDEPPSARLIETLRTGANTVRQRPFLLSLNRLEAWGRPGAGGPVVALGHDGVVGAEALHQRLAHALGVARRAEFTPHLTLLYGRGPSASLPIAPIAWTVRDFVLIHSLVGLTRYEVLGRFPLSV